MQWKHGFSLYYGDQIKIEDPIYKKEGREFG